MAAMHGPADILDDTGTCEEEHEFEAFAQEFNEQNNLHEVDADSNDFENVTEHEGLPPVNIMNITGIVSEDVSIGTTPWTPVKRLPSKPTQSPSRPTLCDKSHLSLSQELLNQSQQSTPGNLFGHSSLTLASPTADPYHSLTQSNDEEPVADSSYKHVPYI